MFKTTQGVQRHQYGVKSLNEHTSKSTSSTIAEYVKKSSEKEQEIALENATAFADKKSQRDDQARLIVENKLFDRQLTARQNSLITEGKTLLFKELMFEGFKDSLLLDSDFVATYESQLRLVSDDFIDQRGGFTLLENSAQKSKSFILNEMKALCERTSRAVTQRRIRDAAEAKTPIESIDFNMNEEEREEFNYEKDKLNIDQISSFVKDKTLKVIKDEKQQRTKEEELQRDLEAHSSETEVKESAVYHSSSALPVYETTLFNAIFENSLRAVITEAAKSSKKSTFKDKWKSFTNAFKSPIKTGNWEPVRKHLTASINMAKSEADLAFYEEDAKLGLATLKKARTDKPELRENIDSQIKWIQGDYKRLIDNKRKQLSSRKAVSESIDYTDEQGLLMYVITEGLAGSVSSIDDDEDSDNVNEYEIDTDEEDVTKDEHRELTDDDEVDDHPVAQDDIDMDLILAESITKYTMLEFAHTIKLEEHSWGSVKELTSNLLK